jgi:putative ATP-dependent endonuclease of the OLD family
MTDVAEAATAPSFAPVYVEFARIINFRGINACELEFEPNLTLLVGRNNAGKSRVLRAVAIAMGGVSAELDDLTVGSDAPATIDVVVAPFPPPTSEAVEEVFDDAITQRLGAIQPIREEPLRERFAWRTTIRRSAEGLGARSDAQLLVFDAMQQAWVLQQNAPTLSRDQRAVFAVDLVDARRDLVEEFTRRGSAVRRVLSDLEVSDETRADLESELADLGSRIVGESGTLEAVRKALEDLEKLVGSIGTPALSPLPVRLEELSRSVAIDLDTGSGALPVRLHGSGARSLASLQVQGVLYDRRLGKDGPALRPHPVTLVEEPEAHLHPQANLELSALLGSLTGQVIASTHSSHLVTAVAPRAIRLIRQDGGASTVIDLGPAPTDAVATHRALRPSTHAEEMEKLKRLVERPFGEVLFSSAIVIGDGATERSFLPITIRHALGARAHGVCVIDPESMGSPLAQAAVKFAKLVGIPWLLFCDTDGPGKADGEALVNAHADGDQTHLVWIEAAAGGTVVQGAIERMLVTFDDQLCRDACLEIRPDLDASQSTLELLTRVKGSVGSALARRLIDQYPDPSSWPQPLQVLVDRLGQVLSEPGA